MVRKSLYIQLVVKDLSFFYLNPLLQVEFRAIFEPFSYIRVQIKAKQGQIKAKR